MPGRPRQFDEDQALQRAMEVFWEKGYEATGVRELLDAMGLCRQSLYDTFGDKRSLYLRAIQRYCDEAAREFDEQLNRPGSPLEAVRELLRRKASAADDPDCRGCLAMNSIVEWGGRDADVAAVLRGLLKRIERALLATLRRAQDEGELDQAVDPRSLAQFVLFVCLGYSALARLQLPPKMARGVLQTALGALATPQVV